MASCKLNFPLFGLFSPELAANVFLFLYHWIGVVFTKWLMSRVWSWLTVIFEIQHLFIKGCFCITQGSCWFSVPMNIQGCVILGPSCGKSEWSLNGHTQQHFEFKGTNTSLSEKNKENPWLVKTMNFWFLLLEGLSKSWKKSFRGLRCIFAEFWGRNSPSREVVTRSCGRFWVGSGRTWHLQNSLAFCH